MLLDYKEKRFVKKVIYSRITIFVVALLLIFVLKGTWNVYKEAKITQKNKEIVELKLNELKKRSNLIQSQVSDLSTSEGKEKEIRSKFQVAKKGEKMIMIIGKKDDYSKVKLRESFWYKLKHFFGF